MKKINRKWEQIIVQKTTDHHHTTRSGDTMNPNKKKERICINLKISVISVICMVIGLALVERQNILQVYIKPLQNKIHLRLILFIKIILKVIIFILIFLISLKTYIKQIIYLVVESLGMINIFICIRIFSINNVNFILVK